jgi:hypothetical protein
VDVLIDATGVAIAAMLHHRFRERIGVPAKDAGSVACARRRASEDARRRAEAPRN